MSFKCQRCGTVQEPGVPATRVVVAVRTVHYEHGYEGREALKKRQGWETAQEVVVCLSCSHRLGFPKVISDRVVRVFIPPFHPKVEVALKRRR